jgi:hypothetical protein
MVKSNLKKNKRQDKKIKTLQKNFIRIYLIEPLRGVFFFRISQWDSSRWLFLFWPLFILLTFVLLKRIILDVHLNNREDILIMDTTEIINSWRWRIVKAGLNQRSFAERCGMSRGAMSEYLSFKKSPSLARFELIEKELKILGV